MYWPCPNPDGTWGVYAAWGHTAELSTAFNQLVSGATTALSSLTNLNAALSAVPATTDDYGDLNALLQDMIVRYQPPNPPIATVAPSGTLTSRPVYLWTGTSSSLSNRVSVGSACHCETLQIGKSPKYCSVAGDTASDASILPANSIAVCQ